MAALDGARGGAIEEGSVGGGTGMNCYQLQGRLGHGLARRRARRRRLHGRRLRAGQLRRAPRARRRRRAGRARARRRRPHGRSRRGSRRPGAGSVIAIVATDAPLLAGPVQGARAARAARPRAHGHDRLALLGRHLPRVLDRQPRRARDGARPQRAGVRDYGIAALRAVDAHGPVLRGRRAGHRGGACSTRSARPRRWSA